MEFYLDDLRVIVAVAKNCDVFANALTSNAAIDVSVQILNVA